MSWPLGRWLVAYYGIEPQAIALFIGLHFIWPSLQLMISLMSDLSNVGQHWDHFSLRLSPSSTFESDGQFSSPQRVLPLRAPLLVRLLLVLLSRYLPSRVSATIRYGWYCGWWRRSKVPVSGSFFGSLLDSPFFVRWQFPCWAPSLLAAAVSPCPRFLRVSFSWLFVVSCGTGWASTSIDNL